MPGDRLDGLKVLIIDDTYEARLMLKNMLMEIGITQVFEVSGAREGMRFIDSAFDFIDIILCDWNMPKMNGLALLRQLRSADAAFPFMMVTGRGDFASVLEAKGAGVSGYILKPYSLLQLETKLRIVATRAQKLAPA
ncbi:MAG: response regulator [Alphaproteobacteria bacterium]|nr:response regulator [Alphaproteobacteria bacterium]